MANDLLGASRTRLVVTSIAAMTIVIATPLTSYAAWLHGGEPFGIAVFATGVAAAVSLGIVALTTHESLQYQNYKQDVREAKGGGRDPGG